MTIAYSGFTGLSGKAGADFLESSRIVIGSLMSRVPARSRSAGLLISLLKIC